MAERDLKIVISAVNNAKRQMDDAVKQLNDMSKGMANVKSSSESMATSVFKGAAAYDLLKTGLRETIAFFKDSIADSMEASRIMTQVATNVKNAGFSYDELTPKIKAYGAMALQLGFDDEDAAQSLSKLLLVTKDYNQARALANLAMDLARNKNIDLDAATRQVTLATQGNVKELKLLGIELDETATTADNLKSMQDQLKDSAVNFAKTSAGQLLVLQQQWKNLKEEVGDRLMPTVLEFFVMIENNKDTIISLAMGLAKVGEAAGWVLKQFVGAGKAIAVTILQAQTAMSANSDKPTWEKWLDRIVPVMSKINLASKETSDKTKQLENELTAAQIDLANFYDGVDESGKSTNKTLEQMQKEWADNAKAISNVLNKQTNADAAIKQSEQDLKDLKEAVADATTEYKDFGKTTDEALAELEDNHKSTMISMSSDITNVQKQLKDLANTYKTDLASAMSSYNDSSKSNNESAAKAIVANEEAIAKLKENISGGKMNKNDRKAAEIELAQRLASEQNNATLITSLSNEVAAVKSYNAMSELDQALFDYQQKKTLAETDYNESVARIKSEYREKKKALDSEMSDLKLKQATEEKLYADKIAFIKTQQKEALIISTAFANSNINITKAQITAEIAYYKQLAEAIKAARSANTNQFSQIQSSVKSVVSTVPKLASGGIVTRPTLAMIGESGPEAVIPLSGNNAGTIRIQLNLDGREVSNIVFDRLMGQLKGNMKL